MSIMPYVGQGLLLGSTMMFGLACAMPRPKVFQISALVALVSSFAVLMIAHITSDFSFVHVVQYSHTTKPLLYKISGVWGNHEGSMLLWLVLFYSLGLWALRRDNNALRWLYYIALSICLFLIMACDPFKNTGLIVTEGQDLNPLLQDPLLAIHPPLLYLGVVASFIPVLLALSGETGRTWRFWTGFSWTFMTIGVTLGSFWAYYELGWGGWWFWDPVENSALVPWLLQTAALHSAIRGTPKSAMGFSFASMACCLLGTFMIRSGLVTSVHSFAVDPERGIFLAMVCAVVLIPLAWGTWKSRQKTPSQSSMTPLTLGIYLLGFSATIIAFGTVYPIILGWFNILITVGAPYFNTTIVPVFLAILILMALDPWTKRSQDGVPAILSAGLSMLILWKMGGQNNLLILVGFGIGIGLITSMFLGIFHRRWDRSKTPMILAHVAVGLSAIGIALSSGFEEEKLVALRVGESTTIHGKSILFDDLQGKKTDNYMAQRALLKTKTGVLKPEKRFYMTQKIIHPETAIQSLGFDHLYITLGDRYDDDSWGFRLAYKPWINLMWLGFALMGLAGLLSLSKRWLVAILMGIFFGQASAIEVHEQLGDPSQEHRAVILGSQLLCPTCNGQPLNESPVEEAQLLRAVIRQQIQVGYTDQQIIEWFVNRYGERVLFSPPLAGPTLILWFLPWFILAIGLIRFRRLIKKPR